MLVYAAEITAYDTVGAAVVTRYYSSDEGFTTKSGDTPANKLFEGRIIQPSLVRRDIYRAGVSSGGRSQIGYGELILNNANGELDEFIDLALDGRSLIIRVGSIGAAYPSGFTTMFRGTMEQPEPNLTQVIIRIRDQQLVATKPMNATKYAGSNTLPNGVEGLESDLKGKPKPRLYGWSHNITPILVNTSKLIYQINDGAIRDVMAAYDGGAMLTRQYPDYSSVSDMETNAPAKGCFRVYLAGGYFRLGSTPFSLLTCDAVEGDLPADRTAAQIFKRILLGPGGLSSGDISASHITALDTANSAIIGLFVSEEMDIQTALDQVAQTVGAWWGSDVTTGAMVIQRLEAPSGTAVATFDRNNIKSFQFLALSEDSGGLPSWKTTVRCVPNNTVQTTGLHSIVSADRRARLAQPYQDAVSENSSIKTAYLFAQERIVETLFACREDGEVEAARQQTLYGVKRDRLEISVEYDTAIFPTVDLGKVVTVTYPRYGFSGGKLMRVLGMETDPRRKLASLTLWG